MPTKRGYRLILAALVVVSGIGLVAAHERSTAPGDGPVDAANVPEEVPPREGITVVSTDSNVWLADEGAGPRQTSELVAYGPDGEMLYHNGTHDRYWDVDPSPVGERTVLYTASDHLNGSACNASTVCTRNVIERVNLTTGEVTRLNERVTPHKHATRWHDVDRIGDERFAVADIYRDRVSVVDTSTGIVEWSWAALQAYDPGSGGPFPRDWTHLNDVEVLEDGRFMVSLRNQDQVVFVDRDEGLQSEWTLGSEDDYDVLHEQHNPDYVPADRGGPAVLVADSENNRVVEYQRDDGDWERTWTWSDARLQWARDADRLPNGNTLITDSNGDRVLEVDPDGEVVWSSEIAFPYEAERLETGDESAGGESAAVLDLASRTAASGEGEHTQAGFLSQVWLLLKGVIPGPVLNGIVYVLPGWFGLQAAVSALVLLGAAGAWIALEWRWSGYGIAFNRPVRLTRERR
jgi:hypothetical protein